MGLAVADDQFAKLFFVNFVKVFVKVKNITLFHACNPTDLSFTINLRLMNYPAFRGPVCFSFMPPDRSSPFPFYSAGNFLLTH